MIRYLALYVIAFAGSVAGTYVPTLSFLSPLSLAVLLFGAIGLWLFDKRPFRDLGFPKSARWPHQLGLSIATGLAIVILFVVILVVSGEVTISPGQPLGGRLPQLVFFTFVFTALIAASEEIIFRGSYFQVIRGRYTLLIGAFTSALLWAIFHLPAMVGHGVPGAPIVLGMVTFTAFGLVLVLSSLIAGGSLWVPIGIHYGYNLGYSILGAIFSLEIVGAPILTGSSGWVPETGLIGVFVWVALALLLLAQFRKRTQRARGDKSKIGR